ncbi:MAG: class I SAM-dependent methyltransferase, partial [Phototrophicaceae bacterium]|jgi:ubiquinone/menaquinone biosynthesis C-methylase UbiE
MNDTNPIKAKVQQQFGAHAQNYVTSTVHSQGQDLDIMLDFAHVTPTDRVLDVATGGGHTALKFAPHVAHVVASDITPLMLEAASAFIRPQAANVSFEVADAEALPFDHASFDVVTCRIAAHHFPDIFKFILASARVLKPGGRLVIHDHVAPPTPRDAEYIDAFERLRDPSHAREFSHLEWRNAFLDAQLQISQETDYYHTAGFVSWVERLSCPPAVVERLTVMMAQAPESVRAWLEPQAIGTPQATFKHHYVILAGIKG